MKTKPNQPKGKQPVRVKTTNAAASNASTSERLSYRDCFKIAECIGMSLGEYGGPNDDTRGLAFTIAGGRLLDATDAPKWLADMNGSPVEDIAIEALKRRLVRRDGRWNWNKNETT